MPEYKITTDRIDSADYRVKFLAYPVVSRGRPKITTVEIPGKGMLTQKEDTYTDTTVELQLNIVAQNADEDAMQLFVAFVSELSQSERLYLDELHGNFFRIKSVDVSDYNQVSDRDIEFSVNLTCDPGEYIEDGRISYDYLDSKIKQNAYSECRPTYQISGNGQCTLTVNGKNMVATVGGVLIIDTDRMLAYQADESIQNALVTGDYEDLYLKSGNNSISITTGFGLKVTPNWEVRIP